MNPSVSEKEQNAATAYFFNALPADLVDEDIIAPRGWQDTIQRPSMCHPLAPCLKSASFSTRMKRMLNRFWQKQSRLNQPNLDNKSAVDSSLAELWSKLLEAIGRVSPFTRTYLRDGHPFHSNRTCLPLAWTRVQKSPRPVRTTQPHALGSQTCRTWPSKYDNQVYRSRVKTKHLNCLSGRGLELLRSDPATAARATIITFSREGPGAGRLENSAMFKWPVSPRLGRLIARGLSIARAKMHRALTKLRFR